MEELKGRTLRGGLAMLCGQGANFALRLAFMVVLARLLSPEDFGLVTMVTVVTGIYTLFTSAGLSAATVQRADITSEQLSTLFWINMLVGAFLAIICLFSAPFIVAFYHEPRLFWITVAMAVGFVFNAAGVQHSALLQRQMRFLAITVIQTLAQVTGFIVGVLMALAGTGYWALIGGGLASSAIGTASVWMASGWLPGGPRRNIAVRSMLHFGGTYTLNSLVVYLAYNFEKMLLGRFWGADALGIYGRAYQLINIPTDNLNSAVGAVAFSALSRLQDDPVRLRNYFLGGYSMVMALTLPTTIFCALFADDIIMVVLGPKWMAASEIFRLLTPTVLIFGIINPLGWLLPAIGLQVRSLRIAFVIAPLVMTAYILGLPYGPEGVALAYSAAMALWFIPHVVWALHGTVISQWDLLLAVKQPLLSSAGAVMVAFGTEWYFGEVQSSMWRLVLAGGAMLSVYLFTLLVVTKQGEFYLKLIKNLKTPSTLTGGVT
jgi:PST family polysaccharide transporter